MRIGSRGPQSSFAGAYKKDSLKRKHPAFTLIEVLIASSIFVIVGLIALTVFVNVLRIQQRISLENAIYEDARFMMERIAREIRQNMVDYEEYYNRLVEENVNYGASYSCYASRFYHPGEGGGPENGGLGTFCNDGVIDAKDNPGCVIDKTSQDINTGTNPFEGTTLANNDKEDANAFCDENFGPNGQCEDPNQPFYLQNQLYLINANGSQKTLLARKTISDGANPEYALAILRLDGEDKDTDGVIESWTGCTNQAFCCAADFDCEQPFTPDNQTALESTLLYNPDSLYKGFVPISPTRTTITSLQFYIAPLDDPYKAFAENSPETLQQPHVTVILSVKPSQSSLRNYNGDADDIPTITLQTTITSRVYNEVRSYYGEGICTNY